MKCYDKYLFMLGNQTNLADFPCFLSGYTGYVVSMHVHHNVELLYCMEDFNLRAN